MNANCPRCENGTINAFRHVANGVCFQCGGTTMVRAPASSSAPRVTPRPCKRFDIKGIGAVEVTREGGEYRVETNHGWMLVEVANGRVRPVIVSDGLRKVASVIVRALTERHRAA